MTAESLLYSKIRHKVEGNILIVRIGKNIRRKFYLEGETLRVDLNLPPLGSGLISTPEQVRCRVYRGEDEEGEFFQGITEPRRNGRKNIRDVGPIVRPPPDLTGFNPYLATLDKMREDKGQRSDS